MVPRSQRATEADQKHCVARRVFASIGPSNGIDMRVCRLKPSSVLSTSRSSQSRLERRSQDGKVHPASGVVAGVRDREDVRREGSSVRMVKVEEGVDTIGRRAWSPAGSARQASPLLSDHEQAGTGHEQGLQSNHDVVFCRYTFFAGVVGRNGRKSVERRLSAELSILSNHDEVNIARDCGAGDCRTPLAEATSLAPPNSAVHVMF